MSSEKADDGIVVSNHPSIEQIADAVERSVRGMSSQSSSESRLTALARTAIEDGRRTILQENEASAPRSAPIIDIGRLLGRKRSILSWIDPLARAS